MSGLACKIYQSLTPWEAIQLGAGFTLKGMKKYTLVWKLSEYLDVNSNGAYVRSYVFCGALAFIFIWTMPFARSILDDDARLWTAWLVLVLLDRSQRVA